MVLRFFSPLSPHLFKLYVVNAEREYTMTKVTLAGHVFSHYPAARYAVDVTFQQSNMPSGRQQERAGYYSAKHKLYGFKTEVSVIPTGLAIGCSHHYHGAVADISIFRSNVDFHVAASTKRNEEDSMPDDDPLLAKYPESWEILADKGYQGLADERRAIHPQRCRPSTPLTLEEEALNHDISSDRIIVGNVFGRLCTLWGVCSDKYRWQEKSYEIFYRACVALTNVHIRVHPLRADDGTCYQDYAYSIGTSDREKHRGRSRRARKRRQLRLATQMTALEDESDEDSSGFSTEY